MKVLQTIERVVKYKTEVIEVSPELVLIVHRTNSKMKSYEIYLKKHCKIDKKKNTFKIIWKGEAYKMPRWEYYSPAIFDEIKSKHFIEINYHDRKFKVDPYKELKAKGKLDEKRILYFSHCDHTVYRLGQDAPVSGVFIFDYIGGITDKDYHFEEAFEHLKKRKSVLEVKANEIPYYNREWDYTKGIYMRVLLPQATLDKAWAEAKAQKDEFPSCRLKDIIIPKPYYRYKSDPLGLKKFMLTEEELRVKERRAPYADPDTYGA